MDSVRAAGSPVESWSKVIGPVYTDAQVEKLLGVNCQGVVGRVESKTLLGLHTGDGKVVFPMIQFVDGDVIPRMAKVLEISVGQVDDWTLASWLLAKQPSLGPSVIEHFRANGADPDVFAVARHAAERWSR